MNVNFDSNGKRTVTLTKSEQKAVRKVQGICDNLSPFDPDVAVASESLAYVEKTYCEPEETDAP